MNSSELESVAAKLIRYRSNSPSGKYCLCDILGFLSVRGIEKMKPHYHVFLNFTEYEAAKGLSNSHWRALGLNLKEFYKEELPCPEL